MLGQQGLKATPSLHPDWSPMLLQVVDQHTVDRLPPSLIEIPHAPSTISISSKSSIRISLFVCEDESSAYESKIEMACDNVDDH
jgi:hypothetical protein